MMTTKENQVQASLSKFDQAKLSLAKIDYRHIRLAMFGLSLLVFLLGTAPSAGPGVC